MKKTNPKKAEEIAEALNKFEANQIKSGKRSPLTTRIIILLFLLPVDIFLVRGFMNNVPGQDVFIVYLSISMVFFVTSAVLVWQIYCHIFSKKKVD